jgi:acetyltransferase-like isoleucine patch superfamily enzyme
VHIGSGTWIGVHSVVLAGITIGENCVIGANSTVTKDIPSHSVAVGSPARVIKSLK